MIGPSKMTRCLPRSISATEFTVYHHVRQRRRFSYRRTIERSTWEYFCRKGRTKRRRPIGAPEQHIQARHRDQGSAGIARTPKGRLPVLSRLPGCYTSPSACRAISSSIRMMTSSAATVPPTTTAPLILGHRIHIHLVRSAGSHHLGRGCASVNMQIDMFRIPIIMVSTF